MLPNTSREKQGLILKLDVWDTWAHAWGESFGLVKEVTVGTMIELAWHCSWLRTEDLSTEEQAV